MTETWYECPKCKKETTLDWDTLSLAGKFTENVMCQCGAVVHINFSVTVSHPADCICSQCADDSLRANISAGVEL